jgi:Xaa-Pro aminopeptidase
VTTERAALFADSRYWVQAERELAGSGIELVRIATAGGAEHVDWLCEQRRRAVDRRGRRQRDRARSGAAAA